MITKSISAAKFTDPTPAGTEQSRHHRRPPRHLDLDGHDPAASLERPRLQTLLDAMAAAVEHHDQRVAVLERDLALTIELERSGLAIAATEHREVERPCGNDPPVDRAGPGNHAVGRRDAGVLLIVLDAPGSPGALRSDHQRSVLTKRVAVQQHLDPLACGPFAAGALTLERLRAAGVRDDLAPPADCLRGGRDLGRRRLCRDASPKKGGVPAASPPLVLLMPWPASAPKIVLALGRQNGSENGLVDVANAHQ